MMINRTSTVLLALILVMSAGLCFAGDGWQSSLIVSSGTASSKLTFGQNPAATDLHDGYYDVPALFSGTLQAAFTDGGETLWRDIRAADSDIVKEWRLSITSDTGEAIKVSWEKKSLPRNARVVLVDVDTGKSLDMKMSSSYTMGNRDGVDLLIEVSYI